MTRYLFFVVTYFDWLMQIDGRRPFGDITNTLNCRKRHSHDQHHNQAVQMVCSCDLVIIVLF